MRKEVLLTLLLFLALPATLFATGESGSGTLPGAGESGSATLPSLQDRLNKLVEEVLPETSEVGIAVYDLTAKKELYTYREKKLCRPASTMKLLTTITALSQPKANEPFITDVWYKGIIEQDTLLGDLYVVGGFDPEFDNASMDTLVARVAALPFKTITGRVYGDVTMKDSLYWGSGWAWDDNPSSFQPYLSPLIYHKGMVKVTATPGTNKGDSATLSCEPVSTFYTVTNTTETKTPAAGKFSVSRNWLENKNDIVVKGNIENKRVGEVNIYPSQDFFMHTFVERLQKNGIVIEQPYDYTEFMQDSTSVHVTRSECSVQLVINQIMKKSDNLSAEALLCKLAVEYTGHRKVSADDGLDAIKEQISLLGHNPADFRIADGCGLSNYNYISPALLVDFLKYAYSRTSVFQSLYKSLPVAGVDGTLQFRMRKGSLAYRNVKAKTGSFTGISTLAGYLKTSKGHDVAFAIMNQNAMSLSKAREFQNKVCELLCAE